MRLSEDNLRDLLLSFHCVGHGDEMSPQAKRKTHLPNKTLLGWGTLKNHSYIAWVG